MLVVQFSTLVWLFFLANVMLAITLWITRGEEPDSVERFQNTMQKLRRDVGEG